MAWKDTISKEFPRALRFERLERALQIVLSKRGFNPANTLLANSLCRDEINFHDVDSLSRFWGEHFDLAGLGGYPSAGVTGFTAMTQHVAPDGRILVIYGPHVAVDIEGNLGKILRKNMQGHTDACGALTSFLAKIRKDPGYQPTHDALDIEQCALEAKLTAFTEGILASSDPLKTLVESTFEVIQTKIDKILNKIYPDLQVALVGGILINTPVASGDYFALRRGIVRTFGSDGRDEDVLGEILEES